MKIFACNSGPNFLVEELIYWNLPEEEPYKLFSVNDESYFLVLTLNKKLYSINISGKIELLDLFPGSIQTVYTYQNLVFVSIGNLCYVTSFEKGTLGTVEKLELEHSILKIVYYEDSRDGSLGFGFHMDNLTFSYIDSFKNVKNEDEKLLCFDYQESFFALAQENMVLKFNLFPNPKIIRFKVLEKVPCLIRHCIHFITVYYCDGSAEIIEKGNVNNYNAQIVFVSKFGVLYVEDNSRLFIRKNNERQPSNVLICEFNGSIIDAIQVSDSRIFCLVMDSVSSNSSFCQKSQILKWDTWLFKPELMFKLLDCIPFGELIQSISFNDLIDLAKYNDNNEEKISQYFKCIYVYFNRFSGIFNTMPEISFTFYRCMDFTDSILTFINTSVELLEFIHSSLLFQDTIKVLFQLFSKFNFDLLSILQYISTSNRFSTLNDSDVKVLLLKSSLLHLYSESDDGISIFLLIMQLFQDPDIRNDSECQQMLNSYEPPYQKLLDSVIIDKRIICFISKQIFDKMGEIQFLDLKEQEHELNVFLYGLVPFAKYEHFSNGIREILSENCSIVERISNDLIYIEKIKEMAFSSLMDQFQNKSCKQ